MVMVRTYRQSKGALRPNFFFLFLSFSVAGGKAREKVNCRGKGVHTLWELACLAAR